MERKNHFLVFFYLNILLYSGFIDKISLFFKFILLWVLFLCINFVIDLKCILYLCSKYIL